MGKQDRLLKLLKEPTDLKTIKSELEYKNQKQIETDIYQLKANGYDIRNNNQLYYLNKIPTNSSDVIARYCDEFALISDTHLGSKVDRVDLLEDFYDELNDRGIKQVFHSGDISEGTDIYRGQLNDLKIIGIDNQLDYIIENYPQRKGITTTYILGNHDSRIFDREGLDVGKIISSKRKDLDYLGIHYARIDTGDDITLDIVHPAGGVPYSIGYAAQKYLRAAPPKTRSDLISFGHRHQNMFVNYDDVFMFEAGCWSGTTDFLRRKGISSIIGGWIVELEKDDGEITKIIPEWKQYDQTK